MASTSVPKGCVSQTIPFPKGKKRGRKTQRGPCAEVLPFPCRPRPAEQPENDACRERLLELMEQRIELHRGKERGRFTNWLDGKRLPASVLIRTSRHGVATDAFGEGGAMFRWAANSIRSNQILRPSQKDQALQLAITQLNAIGLLERLGGLHANPSDKGEASDFAEQVFADLGSTLRRLAMFGGVCKPTPEERPLLEKTKADFDAWTQSCD